MEQELRGDDKLFPLPANWNVGYMSNDGKTWHGQSREQSERLDRMRDHYSKRRLTDQQMAEEIQRILDSEPTDYIFLHHMQRGGSGHFICWADRYKGKIPLLHIEPISSDYEFDGIADMVRKGWIWESSPRACGRPDWIEQDGNYYPAE